MKAQDDFAEKMAAFYKDRWKQVRVSIAALARNPDEEAIHKARVAIKKINSLFTFLESCHKGFDSRHELDELNALFKKMGKVRDHRNMLKLCSRFGIDQEILSEETRAQKKTGKKLIKAYEDCKHALRLARHAGSKQLRHSDHEKWKAYIRQEFQELIRQIAAGVDQEACHPLRKRIKHIVYNAKIYRINGLIKRSVLDRLDELQDRIGACHDVVRFRGQLKVIQYGITHKKEFSAIVKGEKKQFDEISGLLDGLAKDFKFLC